MATSPIRPDPRVRDVRLSDTHLTVDLADGRIISVPFAWFPRLAKATPEQRTVWRIAGGGYGIHWPELDEDLSTDGMLRGSCGTAG